MFVLCVKVKKIMSNDIIKCSHCGKIYFDIGKDECPHCGLSSTDSLGIFGDIFGDKK